MDPLQQATSPAETIGRLNQKFLEGAVTCPQD